MNPDAKRPIIIKKIKKAEHGHHGGAWKIAYADFVTAMMAFFLLMWLLGSTTQGDKEGIAEYFKNPFKPSLSGGSGAGDATALIKGGGEDLTRSTGQVKMTNTGRAEGVTRAEEADTGLFEDLKADLEQLVEKSTLLARFEEQLKIDITQEGLRVQIVDKAQRPMFDLASARMASYSRKILNEIAPVINQLPNRISISGHTDATPFSSYIEDYSNWELSADRANAARRQLQKAGLKEEKFVRIVGLASSVPYDAENPRNPINRRISIIVLNRKTERELFEKTRPTSDVSEEDELSPGKLTPAARQEKKP